MPSPFFESMFHYFPPITIRKIECATPQSSLHTWRLRYRKAEKRLVVACFTQSRPSALHADHKNPKANRIETEKIENIEIEPNRQIC